MWEGSVLLCVGVGGGMALEGIGSFGRLYGGMFGDGIWELKSDGWDGMGL